MKKVRVIMPNGDIFEIDEQYLSQAQSQGARLYEPVKVRKGNDEYEIDKSYVQDALKQGAILAPDVQKKNEQPVSQPAAQPSTKSVQPSAASSKIGAMAGKAAGEIVEPPTPVKSQVPPAPVAKKTVDSPDLVDSMAPVDISRADQPVSQIDSGIAGGLTRAVKGSEMSSKTGTAVGNLAAPALIDNTLAKIEQSKITGGELKELYDTPVGKEYFKKIVQSVLPDAKVEDTDINSPDFSWDNLAKDLDFATRQNVIDNRAMQLESMDKKIGEISSEITPYFTQARNYVKLDDTPLKGVNLQDNASILAAIKTLEKANYFTVNGEEVDDMGVAKQQELMKLLEARMMRNVMSEELDPDIVQIKNKGKIKEAVARFNNDREIENVLPPVSNDDINEQHVMSGLNYFKHRFPKIYGDVLRHFDMGSKTASEYVSVLGSIGQDIVNEKLFEEGAKFKDAINRETELDYSSRGDKKAQARTRIGEFLKESGITKFGPSEIRRAGEMLGENMALVEELALDDKQLFYDAVPRSNWFNRLFMGGVFEPFSNVKKSIDVLSESPAETFVKSRDLDAGLIGKTVDEKGRVSNRLPSDRNNWFYDIIEGFGQFVPQVLATRGLGSFTSAAVSNVTGKALTAGTKQLINYVPSTYVTTFIQEYGSSYEEALRNTGDPGTAKLMASLNSNFAALFELILPDVKIADKAIGGLKKAFSDDIISLVKNNITDPAQLRKAARPYMEKFVTNFLSTAGQEVSEEVATNLTNYWVDSIFSPATVKDRELFEEVLETARGTALAMVIPSLLGAAGQSMSQDFTMNGLNAAALNYDRSKKILDRALEDQRISKTQYENGVSLLSTHQESIKSAPPTDANDNELSADKVLDYAYYETRKKILNKRMEQATSVEKEVLKGKIKELEDSQREILIPKEVKKEEEEEVKADESLMEPAEIEQSIREEIGDEKASQAVNELNEFIDNDLIPEGFSENDKEFAKANPLQFLKNIAEQATKVDDIGGQKVSARSGVENLYGKDVVALAESYFPGQDSQQPSTVSVIKPSENKKQSQVTKDGVTVIRDTPETKTTSVITPEENKGAGRIVTVQPKKPEQDVKRGPAVILPSSQKRQDVVTVGAAVQPAAQQVAEPEQQDEDSVNDLVSLEQEYTDLTNKVYTKTGKVRKAATRDQIDRLAEIKKELGDAGRASIIQEEEEFRQRQVEETKKRNEEFESDAYGDLTEMERMEAVIEDKQATSEPLTDEELAYVNENFFRPKGFEFTKEWGLKKSPKKGKKSKQGDVIVNKEKRKRIADKINDLADRIERDGIDSVFPSWLKLDLDEGTQQLGFGGKALDKAVAEALRIVADVLNATSNMAQAIEQGFQKIKDYYQSNTKTFDEKKLKEQFEAKARLLFRDADDSNTAMSDDPIADFQIRFDGDPIIQKVMLTHMKRSYGIYQEDPASYERNAIPLKTLLFEMMDIVNDVFAVSGFDNAVDYFVSKLKDQSVPLPVRNLLMTALAKSLRHRPDVRNNIWREVDIKQATESFLGFGTRRDFEKEGKGSPRKPGKKGAPAPDMPNPDDLMSDVSKEDKLDLIGATEGGQDILDAFDKLEKAESTNDIPEDVESDVAQRSAEDVEAEKRAVQEAKKMARIQKKLEKKGAKLSRGHYAAKAAVAETRLKTRNNGDSKQQIIQRIKDLVKKC